MTRIDELFGDGLTVSFEFFPPRTPEGRLQLETCIAELAAVDPTFVSVTYGAGGTNREVTRDLVVDIERSQPYPAMPHLTCIGHTRAELSALLADYGASGIDNVLALAGDPPADGSPATGEFRFAAELVELAREQGDFAVAVAAFPEGHPRSPDLATDRRFLADKLSAADFGITQFFFRAEDYLRMRDDLEALGCERPVLPGIMPMMNPTSVRRFAVMNGAWFPEDLAAAVEGAGSPAEAEEIAVDAATALCEVLVREGVPGLHLYGLNRSGPVTAVLERLGLGTGRVRGKAAAADGADLPPSEG